MQTANKCLLTLLEADNPYDVLNLIMGSLCDRIGADHCFWMSFNNAKKTTKCEYEYARKKGAKKLFKAGKEMPFSVKSDFYKKYLADEFFEISDIAKSKTATKLLEKYCGYPDKLKAKSLCCVGFKNLEKVVGSVGFLYTNSSPNISKERLDYMMNFASNLFRTLLLRIRKGNSAKK